MLRFVDQKEEVEDFKFEMDREDPLFMDFEEQQENTDPSQGFWGKLTHLITSQDQDHKLKHLCEMIRLTIANHTKKAGRKRRLMTIMASKINKPQFQINSFNQITRDKSKGQCEDQ